MNLEAMLVVALSVLVWCVVYRVTVEHPMDAVALALYLTALQLLWRPFVLAAGLDEAFPFGYFRRFDPIDLLASTQLLVCLYLLALAVGTRLIGTYTAPLDALLPRPPRLGATALWRLAIIGSLGSTAITLGLLVDYGGIVDLMSARKLDRELTNIAWLRLAPILGSAAALAAMFAARLEGRRWTHRAVLLPAALWLLNSGYSFGWGSRDTAVFGLAAILLGAMFYRPGDTTRDVVAVTEVRRIGLPESGVLAWWRTDHRLARVALAGVIVLGTAFSLRLVRDEVIFGDTLDTIEGESAIRQLAVATNNTQYDSLLMVRTIWPDTMPYQAGDDFVDAVQRAMPLDLFGAPSGPYDPPPLRIAHAYDPDRVNGFPPTPVGEWLINGGWIGVLVGGLISGIALRSLQRRYRDFETNTLSWAVMFVFVGTIMPLGIIVASVFRYKLMALPMLVIMLILRTAPVRGVLERGEAD